jgi:hypothetical protein
MYLSLVVSFVSAICALLQINMLISLFGTFGAFCFFIHSLLPNCYTYMKFCYPLFIILWA